MKTPPPAPGSRPPAVPVAATPRLSDPVRFDAPTSQLPTAGRGWHPYLKPRPASPSDAEPAELPLSGARTPDASPPPGVSLETTTAPFDAVAELGDDLAAPVVGGAYRLLEAIDGLDGSYLARDLAGGGTVFVKLRPAGDRERLAAEAQALAALASPGFAPVRGVGADDTFSYLAYDVPPGRSLAMFLCAGARRPAVALALTSQLLDALAALHTIGVAHGGLHVGQLWVDGNDRIVVFGLSTSPPAIRPPLDIAPDVASAARIFAAIVRGRVLAEARALHEIPSCYLPVLRRALVGGPEGYTTADALRVALAHAPDAEPTVNATGTIEAKVPVADQQVSTVGKIGNATTIVSVTVSTPAVAIALPPPAQPAPPPRGKMMLRVAGAAAFIGAAVIALVVATSGSDARSGGAAVPNPAAATVAEPVAGPESDPDPVPGSDPDPVPVPGSDPVPVPGSDPVPVPVPGSVPVPVPVPVAVTVPVSVPVPVAVAVTVPVAGPAPVAKPKPRRPARPAAPAEPADFAMARRLEESGKLAAAVQQYRHIVRAGGPGAAAAQARLDEIYK